MRALLAGLVGADAVVSAVLWFAAHAFALANPATSSNPDVVVLFACARRRRRRRRRSARRRRAARTAATVAVVAVLACRPSFRAAPAVVVAAAAVGWSFESPRPRRAARGTCGRGRSGDLETALLGGEEDAPKERAAGFSRVLALSRPEWPAMGGATVALLLAVLAQALLPVLFGRMVDAVGSDAPHAARQKRFTAACVELGGIVAASLVFTAARSYVFNASGQKVVARLRGKLFGAMLAQDVAWFDDRRVGDLLNRLSSDTTKLQAAATETVSLALRSALSAVVSLGLLFLTSWRLTLVALSVVPFMTMVTMVCVSVIKRLATRYQAALADAGAVAQEVLSNLRVVRSFGAEDYEVARYRRAVGDPDARGGAEKPAALGVGLEQAAVQALFITMTAAFGYASVLGVWYYGGLLVIRGDMTTGELVAFVMLLLAITTSLSVLAQTGAGVMEALGASVEVFAIIDHPSGIPNRTGASPTRAVAAALASDDAASCEFRDVVFAYAARPGVETTLLHLLARFYDVSGGSVRFDGVDVADFEPAELRVKLALVAQVPALFSGSIADNVAYSALVRGAPRPDMDAVVAAAKAANAHVFTQAFPDGYDSLVGERGVRLSGGQTQRGEYADLVRKQLSAKAAS
ncbi:ATPase [Aureococcus anophagefferens]|nr:ATPase [Aureococcus anophagefferens]